MSKIEFQYKGLITIIQASDKEKFREICSKYAQKTQLDINKVNFLYSGETLNLDSTLIESMNSFDKERKAMTIMVIDNEIEPEKESFIKAPFIVCPTCKEPAIFEVVGYKIKIHKCKNGHTIDNILLSELENTQLIDESKIICDKCKINNKGNTYNKEMFICNKCNMNLCPLCKSKHNNTHKIINYNDKYYICKKHNKEYYSYCEQCKKDICIFCEKEHSGHKIITYNEILPEEENFQEIKTVFALCIKAMKLRFNMLIDRLNNLMKNYESYFKLIERNFNNYNANNINYNILQNINYIYKSFNSNNEKNENILKDCGEFLTNNSYNDFIPKVLNIYNEMHKNEIDLVYNIPNNKNKVQIFGSNFIKNNKDLCKIIYENKEYDLTEYFDCKNTNDNLLKIKLKGINNVTILNSMFSFCSELSDLSDFSNWDTTFVLSMRELFEYCKFEKLPDISNLNTSNVLTFEYLFSSCSSLKSLPDISKWDTSNVTRMNCMFKYCSSLKSLPEISKWDITNAQKNNGMQDMFYGCSDSLNIPDKFKNTSDKSDDN